MKTLVSALCLAAFSALSVLSVSGCAVYDDGYRGDRAGHERMDRDHRSSDQRERMDRQDRRSDDERRRSDRD